MANPATTETRSTTGGATPFHAALKGGEMMVPGGGLQPFEPRILSFGLWTKSEKYLYYQYVVKTASFS